MRYQPIALRPAGEGNLRRIAESQVALFQDNAPIHSGPRRICASRSMAGSNQRDRVAACVLRR
jgi:hypothetical protein